MITPADIESVLDMIEKARAKMEALTNNLTQMRVLLYIGALTYEHAYESWVRDIMPQSLKWAKSCRYCFQEFAKWCREGGVSKKKWRSIKRKLDALNRAYLSFQSVEAEFTHHLTVEWNGRKGFREGKEVGEREGFENGRLKGHDEILARDKSRDEAKGKEYMEWGEPSFRRKVCEFVRDHIQTCGKNGALRLALTQKWVHDGAMHYGAFNQDKGKEPTFSALAKEYKRYMEKQSAKKETKKKPPRKTKPCDFPDGEAKGPDVPVKDPLSKPAQRVRTVTRK